ERPRRLRCFGHDAAGLRAINRESLVDTSGSHIERFSLGPPEQAGIEREGAFALARVQFAPADMTWRPRRYRRRRLMARPFEEHESRAMWIAVHGKTAEARNIFGSTMVAAARRFYPYCVDAAVVDVDITQTSPP